MRKSRKMQQLIRSYISDETLDKNDAVWRAVGYTAQAVYSEAIKGMEPRRAQELRQRLEKLGWLPEDPQIGN